MLASNATSPLACSLETRFYGGALLLHCEANLPLPMTRIPTPQHQFGVFLLKILRLRREVHALLLFKSQRPLNRKQSTDGCCWQLLRFMQRSVRGYPQGMTLPLAAGEVLARLGENGAGKATLLEVVARLMSPHSTAFAPLDTTSPDFAPLNRAGGSRRRAVVYWSPLSYGDMDTDRRGPAAEGVLLHNQTI